MLHRILYFSPAGTTARIAGWIDRDLRERGRRSELINLATCDSAGLQAFDWSNCCLWLGSPVYCDHAIPLVEHQLSQLPVVVQGFSVPFVTWGGVTSGLALPELATRLKKQGFKPLAAAKFLAEHSSTWKVSEPFYRGYPGRRERSLVQQLVNRVCERLDCESNGELNLEKLNYLPKRMREASAGKTLALVKSAMPPLVADSNRCTACGFCVQHCPVQCITLDPYPVIGSTCIRCMQCVRHCPEEAFSFSAETVYERIMVMAEESDEKKESQIYI
ncbi:MAG: EFR1 family ferrodoxin [Desulfuromonadales bacterium]|nr:EFR1 family ferrodoxin [Desulfuromonadales bacterium]MBN2793175.1 EFR1 family ferrodoxin [Desulfuromonadales bacterium]